MLYLTTLQTPTYMYLKLLLPTYTARLSSVKFYTEQARGLVATQNTVLKMVRCISQRYEKKPTKPFQRRGTYAPVGGAGALLACNHIRPMAVFGMWNPIGNSDSHDSGGASPRQGRNCQPRCFQVYLRFP